MGRARREMGTAGLDFDEEQDIQPLEPHRIDAEEIHG
jgi:hypothetical protein